MEVWGRAKQIAAEHLLTTFEGAFILAEVMNDPKLATQQLTQCRTT